MIDLTVKTLDSRNHCFSLEDDITVLQFKEQIAESVAVPADSQRLIYCGRVLQNDKKLIEYDVNGKVIHLVQRAPPQAGQRGNNSGQGQDQGQGQGQTPGQGQGRNHRAHFHHARAQVQLPRIDGNAMYLGAMSFPASANGQGLPRPPLCSQQSSHRMAAAQIMLSKANGPIQRLHDVAEANPSDNSAPPSSQEQPQDPSQEPEQLDQEQELEQDDGSFEISAEVGAGGLAQAINAALSAAGLNNVAALSSAALTSLTLLGGENDGGSSLNIHAHVQRNNTDGGDSATTTNPNDVNPAEQPQATQQQQQTEAQPQGQDSPTQQQQDGSADSNRQSRAPRRPTAPARPQLQELGNLLGYLRTTHDRLRPYLEQYQGILMSDRAYPAGEGPNSVEEVQRVVNNVSEALHSLSHATHAISDFIVDMNQPPPRVVQSRPFCVQHSALLQAGIPIQVEAHISLHGRNQNVNNNNEGGNTPAPATGAAPANPEPAANTEPISDNNTANNPQQPTSNQQQQQQQLHQQLNQQQQQLLHHQLHQQYLYQQLHEQQQNQPQQQQTFGTVFNIPHNLGVLMEVSPEMGGAEQQNQQNRNNNNNNNGNPGGISAGIFPWGASPPPDFMRSLMQMVAGQMARGVATATYQNPGTSAAGEQQATSSEATTTVTATTVDGSNSNPGHSTQARGNTGTHPTTSTQTRSTPRPHVFHSNAHPFGMGLGQGYIFDPFLPCNSHHVRRPQIGTSNSSTASPQQQQATSNPATTEQNQTATSDTNLGASAPRETTASAENATPAPTPQAATAASLPIVNLLTHILSRAGTQTGDRRWLVGGTPVVPNMMPNGSNSLGAGMTLIDLLQNTIGVGVSGNIGIFGPWRMDHTLHGEDLLFDLVVTALQNISLEGWEDLRTGHWEPLTGIRRPVREFFQNFFGSTSLSGSEDRVVDRLIGELQPTINQLLLEDINTRDGPEMGVDVPATIERLLRRHFLNILRLLFDNDVDDTRFAQGLLASIKTLQTEACSVLQYSFRGRQLCIETVAQRIFTRLTEGIEPRIRGWIVNNCLSHVCSYLSQVTQLPDNEVVPLLVQKTTTGPVPPIPSVPQFTVPSTQPEPEPMDTDVVEERVEVEPLEAEEGATFPGHEAVPSDWVPIIAGDGVRQRRQLQVQMQSQGVTGSGVCGFSDAYLGGMPSKRRKLIEQQKPRILLSPTPNHSSVSISMERLVRESVGRAGIEDVEGAAATVATDVGVRRAFGQAIRGCLHQHPQRQTAPDFPDALKFPNATKYFAKNDDTSKK